MNSESSKQFYQLIETSEKYKVPIRDVIGVYDKECSKLHEKKIKSGNLDNIIIDDELCLKSIFVTKRWFGINYYKRLL